MVMAPNGRIEDDEPQTTFTPTAAIPSRATQPAPMFEDPPRHDLAAQVNKLGIDSLLPADREERPRKRRAARNNKKMDMLPAREIKRINTNRKKKKTKKRAVRKAVPVAPRVSNMRKRSKFIQTTKKVVPKNPNRPLEMKNKLATVLGLVGQLQKAELVSFTNVMRHMENLSRSGRKRVIAALQQVYT